MGDNYKEALQALHEALSELKALGRQCEAKIQAIEIILEKQGLKDWEAGAAVNKEYCEKSHEKLTCDVKEKLESLEELIKTGLDKDEKTINSKFRWIWGVIVVALGIYGSLIAVLMSSS